MAMLRADDFIESIGVGTHLSAATTTYGNVTTVEQALAYLGVDNVRDQSPGPSRGNATLNAFYSLESFVVNGHTYTTKFDLISGTSLSATMTYVELLAPYTAYVEGPNEVNKYALVYTPLGSTVALVGKSAADAFQKDLYNSIRADPALNNTSVMTFSLGPGSSYDGFGNVAAYADDTNVHAYGQYGIPPHWFLQAEITAVTTAPGRPYIVTETGNYTLPNNDSGVSEPVQAKLLLDTLLDDFMNGVKLTYLYELLDPTSDPTGTNSQDHYGLFHTDGTPKVSATAIHNLTAILADPSATSQSFTPVSLNYTVTGLPLDSAGLPAAYQFAMEKSDGVYDIALWWEPWIWDRSTNTEITFAPSPITVTFGAAYHTINLYDPLSGTTPIATYHDTDTVDVALGTGPLILEVEQGLFIATGSAGGVFTSTGPDMIAAGSGAATVNASASATITGSTGSLAVVLTGSTASVSGGSGPLSVTSNSGSNTITGGSGPFNYTDRAANDVITTDNTAGVSTLLLGTGNDTVIVDGPTSIAASRGNLTVIGNADLSINGGLGSISLTGSVGNEYVFTQAGTSNLLSLGSGKNTVLSHGADTIQAGSGKSTVYAAGASAVVYGGTGTLGFSAFAAASIYIGGSAAAVVSGGAGTLTATLNSAGNRITGGAGALTVTDNTGGNTISGGAGTLTLSAPVGADLIATNNTTGVSNVTLGTGADTIAAGGATNIIASRANLTVTGNGDLSITGGFGGITLTGGTGSQYLFTQPGTKNLLNLGSGKNTVLSHGADTINASTAIGSAGTGIYAGGPDLITGGSGTLSVNGQANAVSVFGGTGAVKASAAGSFSYLKGGSNGGNVLSASNGNTTLVGAGPGDVLTDTGSGNNLLVAGAGAETLSAGSGNDTLVGGSGTDLFVLTKAVATHSDLIQGFKPGTDHLSFAGFGTAAPIASQQVVGGSLQLTLADTTQVTLLGVTSLG